MLITNTYSLDSLVSFNSKLEDYFTNNTTKAINAVYENFLSKNIKRLKNKDKTILKEINSINVNYLLIDNLNYLWNSGFNINTNDFSSNVLTEFALTEKEKIAKNKKLTTTLRKEDRKIARDIRKRDIEEKTKTLKILKSDVITSNFGQTYLQERNKEIARNFTNTYKEKIFSGINNYFNQKYSITREKNLINHLSFKRLRDLSPEERAEYINEYNNLANIYGLDPSSLNTYDSLKFNPKERIRRIAKTELSAAYNLARYDELVKQGYTAFQIKNNKNTNACELCKSKHNDIITIDQITNIDGGRGFTDFRGIDTRKDKNAPENSGLIFSPLHPNCFVAGTKVLLENKVTKNIEDVVIGDKIIVGISNNNADGNDVNNVNNKSIQTEIVRSVYNVMKNIYKDYLITLVLENGKKITATRDHPVFNGTQFRSIGDFCIGDYVYTNNKKDISISSNSSKNVFRGFTVSKNNIRNSSSKQQNCKTYSSVMESGKEQSRVSTSSMDKKPRKTTTTSTILSCQNDSRSSREITTELFKEYRSPKTFFRKNENKQSFSSSSTQTKNTRRYCKIKKQKVLSKFRWNCEVLKILSRRLRYDLQKLLGSQFCQNIKSFKSNLVLRDFILQVVKWYLLQTRFLFTKTKSDNRNKRLHERRFTDKTRSISEGISSFKTKNNRRKEIPVSTEIFSGLTKLRVKEIQKEYYEGLVYNLSVDEFGDYNYYFASNDDCFVLTHNCSCFLIGVQKSKTTPQKAKTSIITKVNNARNAYAKADAALSVINLGASLGSKFLALQAAKKDKQDEDLLKVIIAGGSIMSMAMMYYFFTNTKFGTKVIAEKTTDLLLKSSTTAVKSTTDTLQDRLREAVLNKDYIQSNLAEIAFKPPTTETLSQYLNKQQRQVINQQLSTDIRKYITKTDLEELLKTINISALNISNLRDLGKGDLQQLKLSELEVLLNALLVNNKTTSKTKLIDLIFEDTRIKPVVARIPLNIKQPDLLLIENTQTKLLATTTRLERLGTQITKLNTEVKKNKSTYLKDIETLRELDSELTEQLVGIERLNSEYNQLLETTTDTKLSRYLTDKVIENNQTTSNLRNKLNDISNDLYGTKLDKVDPALKPQLITNIKDKGEQYLEFKNNRGSKVASINKTLDNYKKDISIDKLNVNYIDNRLAELDKLEVSFKELNNNSLVLDNILSDYAILSKIDNNVNVDDLGYTFKSYLNTGDKRSKALLNVDDFRETSLTNTKTNLDNYKKKLIIAKYKLLNNEPINEFKLHINNKFSKLCHIKLKNILEKLRKV